MPRARKCWIDNGGLPPFEGWVTAISETGATIALENDTTLPATFIVYFDIARSVGRESAVEAHDGNSYRILFIRTTSCRSIVSSGLAQGK